MYKEYQREVSKTGDVRYFNWLVCTILIDQEWTIYHTLVAGSTGGEIVGVVGSGTEVTVVVGSAGRRGGDPIILEILNVECTI